MDNGRVGDADRAARSPTEAGKPSSPSGEYPSREVVELCRLLDLAAAHSHRDEADALESLRTRLGRDGLSFEEWNALLGAASTLRLEAARREGRASGIAARSAIDAKRRGPKGKSPAPKADAQNRARSDQ